MKFINLTIGEEFDFPMDADDSLQYRCEKHAPTDSSDSINFLKGGTTRYVICEIKEDKILFDYSLKSENHFIMDIEEFKSMFDYIEKGNYEIY